MNRRLGSMTIRNPKAERNRTVILKRTAEAYRDLGFDGIGIRDLGKIAGLTHGAVYAQFKDKDDLLKEAMRHSAAEQKQAIEKCRREPDPISAVMHFYLSAEHRDRRAAGCLIAANASEVVRRPVELQAIFIDAIEDIVNVLESNDSGSQQDGTARAMALTSAAAMIGGLTLSRIYATLLPEQSSEILDIIRNQLLTMLNER
jgi:TetR/AcrR family transcriptional repressor of nem operon